MGELCEFVRGTHSPLLAGPRIDRILAIGRNEAGQLGVGFASQEGTRSLVEGFEGEEILAVRAGFQSSYLLLRDGGALGSAAATYQATDPLTRRRKDSTVLYSCGNLARGRLGHPDRTSSFNEAESAAGQEPRRHLLPQATAVPLPPELGRIKQVEAGFEHVLLLTESGEVYGTGCNTDGQIGLGDAATDVMGFTRIELPPEIAKEGGVARISAGADTSALVTASGRVWSWGNSVRQTTSPSILLRADCENSRRNMRRPCRGVRSTRSSDRPRWTTPSCRRTATSSTIAAEALSRSPSTVSTLPVSHDPTLRRRREGTR